MTLLTEKQTKLLIKNMVSCIMDDLDNFYYDELLLKAKEKQLKKYFTDNFHLIDL